MARASRFQPVRPGEGPCVGVADPTDAPTAAGQRQWNAPEQVIDPTHVYCAILTSESGRIVAQLYPEIAPQHVNSFVFLARNGYFDGLTWHRVLPDFVAQTGDPTGAGSGGPGYVLPLEVSARATYDRDGVLGMARTNDPNSAGSQFFITFGPQPALNPSQAGPGYTIFGQVVEGMDAARAIRPRDPSVNPDAPAGETLISVRIVDLGAAQ
ncbi:MAG: peptidylprolyl isomerase [Anaerolineae bacterium]|nr:peptidylprolyl isomerase [Anaerolineae bacterium]